MTMDYRQCIVRDPALCGGEPVLNGTRVTVQSRSGKPGRGHDRPGNVKDFPTLGETAVRAVIAFAAASAEEGLPVPPAPSDA